MKVGSLFSGIGGFDLGLNFPVSWQVEKDKDCNRVLAYHWPEAQRFNDVKEVGKDKLAPVDLICGGFPCQDLSVAGKRAGLDGERSGLWFEFHRIIRELSPAWVLIENVPGLLSSAGGGDFAIILSGLAECGYHAAWRILDAQYFGVPQRRRRVFIVASLGSGRCAQVLFESTCGCGDTPPSREAGEEVAGTIGGGSADSRRGFRNDLDTQGAFVTATLRGGSPGGSTHGKPSGTDQGPFVVAPPLTSNPYGDHESRENLLALCVNSKNNRLDGESQTFVAHQVQWASGGGKILNDTAQALRSEAEHNYQFVQTPMQVRRLTPTECLRLQGFPDNWLDLPPPLSDSAKYRMTGNAVAVPVIEWIGRRIMEVDAR